MVIIMKLELGVRIRELRRRDGRTQEELAQALGVTPQAVSRWESGGSYPDMELMPAIANLFGVSIDALFGCQGEREAKIDALLAAVNDLDRQNFADTITNDECIAMLRTGLAQFPGNERLTHRLALLLSETGWMRHKEWLDYGEDGYIRHSFDRHRTNEYWQEAAALWESLLGSTQDDTVRTESVCGLTMLYRNFGEYEKAVALADRLPPLACCREITRTNAIDGPEQARYLGDALLKLAEQFAELTMYALVNSLSNFTGDLPIKKVEGLIALFDFLCDDGNLGYYHKEVVWLYLYLSRLQWEHGLHDEAFASLDEALRHGRAFDRAVRTPGARYTATLVRHVPMEDFGTAYSGDTTLCSAMADAWPMWCNPDYSAVEREIKADPRWDAWVRRTKEAQ